MVRTVALFPVTVMPPLVLVIVGVRAPVEEKIPVESVFAPRASVPWVRVKVLAVPSVTLSPSVVVMPDPLTVSGIVRVLPLVVTVPVWLNVKTPVPAPTVMPDDTVKLPSERATFVQVPENPVKSRPKSALLAVRVTVSEPPVTATVLEFKMLLVVNVRVPVDPA